MKKTMFAFLALLIMSSTAIAADSIGVGVRYGGEFNSKSNDYVSNSTYFEGFADIFLNSLISVGGSLAYQASDLKAGGSISDQKSYPITALFKLYAPIPFVKPYAGAGQAIIFHDNNQRTNGSPVAFAGLDISYLPLVFLNVEYRHQFNGGDLDFIAGGIGVKF
jgi:hypothetical protein